MNSASAWDLIDRLPGPHAAVLHRIARQIVARGAHALAIHGSLVKGGVDVYSDVDVTIVCPVGKLENTTQAILSALTDVGEIFAQFRADHLDSCNTIVAYLDVRGTVVKLDAAFCEREGVITLPAEATFLIDECEADAHGTRRTAHRPEPEVLFAKLCGWLWFTYARLARGELFAAARSIDFSREAALLPLIHLRLNNPNDGHRRVEWRLPRKLIEALRATHPASLDCDELIRALESLKTLILAELDCSELSARFRLRDAIVTMWDRIITDHATSMMRREAHANSGSGY